MYNKNTINLIRLISSMWTSCPHTTLIPPNYDIVKHVILAVVETPCDESRGTICRKEGNGNESTGEKGDRKT